MKKSLLIITFLLSLCTSAQTVVYVDAGATGSNDGSSWTNAYTILNNAIANHANTATDFWIAEGNYVPGSSRTTSIIPQTNHRFYGGFNGSETMLSQRNVDLNETVINGDINSNDSGVINFTNGTRSDNTYRLVQIARDGVVFDGITFKNGHAAGSTNNGSIERMGAAIFATHEFSVNNCKFVDNFTLNGGAIQLQGQAAGANHNIEITNSEFTDNVLSLDGIIATSNGSNSTLELTLENCLITDNIFDRGVLSVNAARSGVNMTFNVLNSTIAGNETDGSPTDNQVLRNRRSNNSSSVFNIENSIIWNNYTTASTANSPVRLNGLSFQDGNNGGVVGVANIDYSLTQSLSGATSSSNNLTIDPLFISAGVIPYALSNASPAIDSGDNNRLRSSNSTDLLGNSRIFNNTVDIGAYEFNGTASGTIYVNINATGSGNGTNWTDAFTDLAVAIGTAGTGEYWVATGNYTPGNSRTSTFNLNQNDIEIYGGFNGTETLRSQRDPTINVTTLTGDLNGDDTGVSYTGNNRGDNSFNVITVNAANCAVDGVTITSGHANGSTAALQEGAAISVFNGNFKLSNSRIEKCVTTRGGAIRAIDQNGLMNIDNIVFTENLGNIGPIIYARAAGGTFDIQFNNCLIFNNRKESLSSANGIGLAWFRQDTNALLRATINNCTIADNTADNSTTGTPVLTASQINSTNGMVQLKVYNSIFWNNVNSSQSNAHLNGLGNGTTSNGASLYEVRNSLDETAFSNIANNGNNRINTNNLSTNPLFTSTIDFSLQSGSPAIDTGINSLVPSNITTDLAGNNRIANNTVDIGAYEFGATASIEESANLRFTLYPNPVSDILNVDCGDSAFAKAEIFNLQGQRVATSKTKEINVQELKTGMYLIKVETTDGAVASQQFIKK